MTTPKSEKSYYGPFFWIAAVSFIVPLFVAVRAFDHIGATVGPTPVPDASGVDHALWDYALKAYVANGLVDYDGMAKDQAFRTYLKQLGAAQPEKLATDDERLALLCNAYNAFVISGVIRHDIRDSVNNYSDPTTQKGFFDIPEYILANETLSLNDIEHKKIREPFGDPRIHVALVCAALSCPAIRPEAFEGARLEAAFRVKLLCRFCLDEGFIEIAVGEAVYLFVQFPGARDLRFQQLNGRSLAGLEQLQKLRCRSIGQINIGHGQFPRIRVRQEFEP